jgi:hypothetical protein
MRQGRSGTTQSSSKVDAHTVPPTRSRLFGQSLRPSLVCHLSIHGSQFASTTPSCLRSRACWRPPCRRRRALSRTLPPTRGEVRLQEQSFLPFTRRGNAGERPPPPRRSRGHPLHTTSKQGKVIKGEDPSIPWQKGCPLTTRTPPGKEYAP